MASSEQQAGEWEALRRLNDAGYFWGFNLLVVFSAALLEPWPLYEALAAAVVASSAYEAAGGSPWLGLALADECPDGGEGGVQWWPASAGRVALLLLLLPVLCFLSSVAGLMLHVALKWAIVGRYSEGDYPFFGEYHVKWMVMMLLAGGGGRDRLARRHRLDGDLLPLDGGEGRQGLLPVWTGFGV